MAKNSSFLSSSLDALVDSLCHLSAEELAQKDRLQRFLFPCAPLFKALHDMGDGLDEGTGEDQCEKILSAIEESLDTSSRHTQNQAQATLMQVRVQDGILGAALLLRKSIGTPSFMVIHEATLPMLLSVLRLLSISFVVVPPRLFLLSYEVWMTLMSLDDLACQTWASRCFCASLQRLSSLMNSEKVKTQQQQQMANVPQTSVAAAVRRAALQVLMGMLHAHATTSPHIDTRKPNTNPTTNPTTTNPPPTTAMTNAESSASAAIHKAHTNALASATSAVCDKAVKMISGLLTTSFSDDVFDISEVLSENSRRASFRKQAENGESEGALLSLPQSARPAWGTKRRGLSLGEDPERANRMESAPLSIREVAADSLHELCLTSPHSHDWESVVSNCIRLMEQHPQHPTALRIWVNDCVACFRLVVACFLYKDIRSKSLFSQLRLVVEGRDHLSSSSSTSSTFSVPHSGTNGVVGGHPALFKEAVSAYVQIALHKPEYVAETIALLQHGLLDPGSFLNSKVDHEYYPSLKAFIITQLCCLLEHELKTNARGLNVASETVGSLLAPLTVARADSSTASIDRSVALIEAVGAIATSLKHPKIAEQVKRFLMDQYTRISASAQIHTTSSSSSSFTNNTLIPSHSNHNDSSHANETHHRWMRAVLNELTNVAFVVEDSSHETILTSLVANHQKCVSFAVRQAFVDIYARSATTKKGQKQFRPPQHKRSSSTPAHNNNNNNASDSNMEKESSALGGLRGELMKEVPFQLLRVAKQLATVSQCKTLLRRLLVLLGRLASEISDAFRSPVSTPSLPAVLGPSTLRSVLFLFYDILPSISELMGRVGPLLGDESYHHWRKNFRVMWFQLTLFCEVDPNPDPAVTEVILNIARLTPVLIGDQQTSYLQIEVEFESLVNPKTSSNAALDEIGMPQTAHTSRPSSASVSASPNAIASGNVAVGHTIFTTDYAAHLINVVARSQDKDLLSKIRTFRVAACAWLLSVFRLETARVMLHTPQTWKQRRSPSLNNNIYPTNQNDVDVDVNGGGVFGGWSSGGLGSAGGGNEKEQDHAHLSIAPMIQYLIEPSIAYSEVFKGMEAIADRVAETLVDTIQHKMVPSPLREQAAKNNVLFLLRGACSHLKRIRSASLRYLDMFLTKLPHLYFSKVCIELLLSCVDAVGSALSTFTIQGHTHQIKWPQNVPVFSTSADSLQDCVDLPDDLSELQEMFMDLTALTRRWLLTALETAGQGVQVMLMDYLRTAPPSAAGASISLAVCSQHQFPNQEMFKELNLVAMSAMSVGMGVGLRPNFSKPELFAHLKTESWMLTSHTAKHAQYLGEIRGACEPFFATSQTDVNLRYLEFSQHVVNQLKGISQDTKDAEFVSQVMYRAAATMIRAYQCPHVTSQTFATVRVRLLPALFWAPCLLHQPQTVHAAIEVWRWLLCDLDHAQDVIVTELCSLWRYTINSRLGIFSEDPEPVAPQHGAGSNPPRTTPTWYESQILCQGHLLMFLFEIMKTRMTSSTSMQALLHLVHRALGEDVVPSMSHHPIATPVRFRLLVMALHLLQLLPRTLSIPTFALSILQNRVLNCAVQFFEQPPKYHDVHFSMPFGGSNDAVIDDKIAVLVTFCNLLSAQEQNQMPPPNAISRGISSDVQQSRDLKDSDSHSNSSAFDPRDVNDDVSAVRVRFFSTLQAELEDFPTPLNNNGSPTQFPTTNPQQSGQYFQQPPTPPMGPSQHAQMNNQSTSGQFASGSFRNQNGAHNNALWQLQPVGHGWVRFDEASKVILLLASHEIESLVVWRSPTADKHTERPEAVKKWTDVGNRYVNQQQWQDVLRVAYRISTRLCLSLVMRFGPFRQPCAFAMSALIRHDPMGFMSSALDIQFAVPFVLENLSILSKHLHMLSYFVPCKLHTAMSMLKAHHTSPVLVRYALRSLQSYSPQEVLEFMPQLLQALRFDSTKMVEQYLINAAVTSPIVCHRLIWLIRAEGEPENTGGKKHNKNKSTSNSSLQAAQDDFHKLIDALREKVESRLDASGKLYATNEFGFFEKVTSISGVLLSLTLPAGGPGSEATDKERLEDLRKERIKQELHKVGTPPPNVYLPTSPHVRVNGIDCDSGIPLQSAAKVPIMVTFLVDNSSPGASASHPTAHTAVASSSRFKTPLKIASGAQKIKMRIRRPTIAGVASSSALGSSAIPHAVAGGAVGNSGGGSATSLGASTATQGTNSASQQQQQHDQAVVPIARQACIFKVGDDCRQDQLALQMIRCFRNAFQEAGLDLYVYPYNVVSTDPECGVIEVVPNTKSLDQLGKLQESFLYEHFIRTYGKEDQMTFQAARRNFVRSMAAYAVICYILQIKDRHNGNILLDKDGHVVHIDFGFIYETSPANNLKFEKAPFKLTGEMMHVMGDTQSNAYEHFRTLCIKAFLVARRHMHEILAIAEGMANSGLPCFFFGEQLTMRNLYERFAPNSTERQAAEIMKELIKSSESNLTTDIYDWVQHLQQGITYR